MTRSSAAWSRKTSCAAVIVLGLVWTGACQQRTATTVRSEVSAGSSVGSAGATSAAGSAGSAVAPAAADAGSAAGAPSEFGPGGAIRYAAKAANTDFFSINEDEQAFFIASWDATGAAATKRAAEAFEELYRKTVDLDATWPYPMDPKRSYIENRLACGIRSANAALQAAPGRQRAMAIAAVVSGDAISIAHVGKDRAYLVRDGQIRQLTLDHSMLEEYRREHPDAAQADLDRLPRKDVLTRALGRRDSVEVDVLTERVRDGDRILLASEALHRTLEEQTILEAVREHGLEKADLEEAVQGVWDRAARRGGPQVTVILLGFVMKQR